MKTYTHTAVYRGDSCSLNSTVRRCKVDHTCKLLLHENQQVLQTGRLRL